MSTFFLGVFDTSIGNLQMPPAGEHTAFILHLMNAIDDASNGVSGDNRLKRIPWTKDSYHDEFFRLARRQLRSMRFVDRKTRKAIKTDLSCIQNSIDTMNGFLMLWKQLQSRGFTSFKTRKIN